MAINGNGNGNGSNGHPQKSAAREILDYERKVNASLSRFHNRTQWEPQETKTPLSALVMAEDGMLDEWSVINETVIRLAGFLSQDGIEPWNVLRNLYAVFGHMGIEPFCQLTDREKSVLFGDSHGSHHWLMHRMCVDVLRRKGARAVKAPGQKNPAAAASAAEAVLRAAEKHGYFNRSKKKPKPKSTRTGANGRKKTHDNN